MLRKGKLPEAYALAQTAVQRALTSVDVQYPYAQIALASGHLPEGRQALATALPLAQTHSPEFQQYFIDEIQHPPPHP